MREILPASWMEEVEGDAQKYEELRKTLPEYELIVDSVEQPTARPVDYEEQKNTIRARKRCIL